MLPLAKVDVPVPTLKALEPVTLVAPFRLTAPVPVPKVLAPVWVKVLLRVVAPVRLMPLPPLIVVVDEALVEPRTMVWAAPVELAMLTVVVLAVAPVTPMLMVLLLELLPRLKVVVAMTEAVVVVLVLPIVTLVALLPPMARAPPDRASKLGAMKDVSLLPVPLIQKTELACCEAFWFWM